MPGFWRHKESTEPLPPMRAAVPSWVEIALVRDAANGHLDAVLNGGKVEGGRRDPLPDLADRVAAAVEQFMTSPEGARYAYVMQHGQLPPATPAELQSEAAKRAAFLRRLS